MHGQAGASMERVSCRPARCRVRAIVAVAAILVVAGCAAASAAAPSVPGVPSAAPARANGVPAAPVASRSIAVVPVQYAPEVGVVAPSHAATEAAAKGAVLGAAQGALTGMQFLVAGPAGVAAAIGMTLAYAALGAAGGAASVPPDTRIGPAVPRETTSGLREAIVASVASDVARFTPFGATVVPGIGPRSRDDAPDYRSLAPKGFADVVEVAAAQVGLVGQGGADPMFTLVVTARARRVDTASGTTTASRGLVYQSPRYTRDEWMREGGGLMRAEMSRAGAALAGRIVDDLLLGAEFATEPDAERLPPMCGVAPVDPVPDWRRDPVYDRELAQSRVASVTPTLAWEARPPSAWPYDRVPWERATDLRYDLRIWSAEDHIPGDLVYERVGLAATSHTVESALAPRASYFWSIRLRYTIDGEPRTTRWSAASRPAFRFVLPMGDALSHAPVQGGASPSPTCAPASFSPCACLDFIPAANYLWLRTP
jgi:hypothetical protein